MEIDNMRKINAGSIKAYFSVKFSNMAIHGFKLIQQDGQSAWVAAPDEKYEKRDGTTGYKRVVEILDDNLKEKILQAAEDHYRAM